MPRTLARLALLTNLIAPSACAKQAAAPRYPAADELTQCQPNDCVEAELSFRHWADAAYHRGSMPYHCDPGSELDGPPDPAVTRMIFVVHGIIGPSPDELARMATPPGLLQLRNVQAALRKARQADPSLDPAAIAIIAPTFQRTTHWQPYTDENPRNWTWTGSDWKFGQRSVENESFVGIVKADAVSSFDIFDEFMRAALIKFPNLEQLVIAGHSAGGQAVHRYAWLGVGVHERLEAEGIHVRYMPANPGLYTFPLQIRKLPPGQTSVRPGAGHGDTLDWQWTVPRGCKGYDDWGYGLDSLDHGSTGDRTLRAVDYAIEHYLRPIDRKLARLAKRDGVGSKVWKEAARRALRLQYASREIWHIQAATDFEDTFGTNCRTTVQGRSRWERFSNFQEAWTRLVDIEAPNLHFVALDDATHPHSSRVVYASEAGLHLLFH